MASLQDPASANAAFGEGRGIAMFLSHYREFVALPSARDALGRVFAGMLDEQRRPALLHCMGGKDRTGWAVAALLLLLGVEKDVMMQDYLASNDHLEASFDGFMADFKARGGDPEVIAAFMWARAEYLESALDEMRSSFDTIERYFAEGLGLGGAGVKALRDAFLDGV